MNLEFPKHHLKDEESYTSTAAAWQAICNDVLSECDKSNKWQTWFQRPQGFNRTLLEGAPICAFVNRGAGIGFLIHALDDEDERLAFSAYLKKLGGADTESDEVQTLVLHSAPKHCARVRGLLCDWVSETFSLSEISERLKIDQ